MLEQKFDLLRHQNAVKQNTYHSQTCVVGLEFREALACFINQSSKESSLKKYGNRATILCQNISLTCLN